MDSNALYWVGNHNNLDIAENIIAQIVDAAYPQNVLDLYDIPTSSLLASSSSFDDFNLYADSSNVVYEWDNGLSTYSRNSRIDMSLDTNGNVATETIKNYNGSSWENVSKNIFTYDGQSRITEIIEQDSSGSVFENSYKDIYTYDAQGRLSQTIEMDWDEGSSSWKNSDRDLFTYDAQGRLVRSVYQSWEDGLSNWEDGGLRATMTYTSGSMTGIYEGWDGTQWEKSYKTTITYYGNDNPLTSISWNWSSGSWVENDKEILTYDGSGNLATYIEQDWGGSAWENENRYTYSYNSGDKVTATMFEDYNDTTSSFDTSGRMVFTLNNDNQCTSLIAESWTGSAWTQASNGNEKIIFHYEDIDDGTGIHDVLSENDFSFFPNPAKDELHIKMANSKLVTGISITDISGRVVFKTRSGLRASELTIPLSKLTDGLYYLQVTSGGQKGTKPFVVRH